MKPNRLTFARSLALRLLPSLLALAGYAHAQNQTVSGNLTVTNGLITGTTGTGGGMELRLGGLVIAKGTLNSSPALATADEGAGTRLLWHPKKAAFRAGTVTGTLWDEANIGAWSTAFGRDTDASGEGSTAMGIESYARGLCSTAIGCSAGATGEGSTAIGYSVTVSGDYTTALGIFTLASGSASTAMGSSTSASGFASTAMGFATEANAHSSLALGRYNIGDGNPTSWIPTDPLFEIGNGTEWNNRKNALTVFKNGNMDVQGVVTCAPGGDIPMFTGN